ncbi:MAG TPA: AAA family ATPase [Microlunatus sp.]|nr:AAA family ATPase [Microlunatus sp.]
MGSVFVGRAAELAALRAAWTRACSGAASVLLVEGDAGDGKSCLLREFLARTPEAASVWVSADAAERQVGYGLSDGLAARLDDVASGPGRRAEHAGRRHGPGADLLTTGEGLLERLRRTSAGRPLAVVVDDAFWADRPSLGALTYALRRLCGEPVLTVVTTRSEETLRLPQGLVRLADHCGPRIRLSAFGVAEIRDLVRSSDLGNLTERAARRLQQHTGGSPLHLRALLGELASAQPVDWLSDRLAAPRPFARLVTAQLDDVSPQARRLAAAAAVLGQRSSLGDAAKLAELSDPFPAAEELRSARLVDVMTGQHGQEIAFTHVLVRSAVYEGMGPASRAVLHRGAAGLTAGEASLFHLGSATAGTDEALASAFEDHAVRKLATGSWRPAAQALLEAARLTGPGAWRDARLLRGVDALLVAGDLAAARSYGDQLAELPPTAQRLQVEARLAWLSGRYVDAEQLAVRAWSSLDGLDGLERDRLAAMLSQMCIMQGKSAEAMRWSADAMSGGRLDARFRASTMATHVAALIVEQRVDEAMELLPGEGGDLSDPGYRELSGMRGILQLLSDDPASAVRNFRIRLRPNLDDHQRGQSPIELLTATSPDGIEPNKLIILAFLAEAEYRRGNWDIAASVSAQAVALVDDSEQAWIAGWVHAIAVLVAAARGEWTAAEDHLSAARASVAESGDGLIDGYVGDAAVHLAACRGDASAVVAEAEPLTTVAQPYHQQPGMHLWPVTYASALVALGRVDQTLALLDRWEIDARRRQHHSRLAGLARVRGELAVRNRDLRAARAAFDEAVRLGEGVSDPVERGRLLTDRGAFLRRRGERRNAVADLQAARQLLVVLGARPLLARIDDELRACGQSAGCHEQPVDGLANLTPQENAVMRLVAEGYSNRQVGEALFLSSKTVAYHLGHVYTKLGITSRGQLAAQRARMAPNAEHRSETSGDQIAP